MNKNEKYEADEPLFRWMSGLEGKYLISGILGFLSPKELKPLFHAVRNKHIRESLNESIAWKQCLLSSISYLTYLDQTFIRLDEKMYWPVFQDVFANDIKNFEKKLASIEISDEIRDKFDFSIDCGKIVSHAMYFWIKIMSMENIAFDILSLTQQDFDDYYLKKNDNYYSDMREGKVDLNLWEVVKDILSKSSKDRVNKIFDKFKDRQIGDYEIETFDFYSKESGKKFDECENREIIWLNLCATLKQFIKNEYSDIKKKADSVTGMCSCPYDSAYIAAQRVYSLPNSREGVRLLNSGELSVKKCTELLIPVHQKLQSMKDDIIRGFCTQEYKMDMKKLIQSSKDRREIFEWVNYRHNYYVFAQLTTNYAAWCIEYEASVESIKGFEQECSYITIMSMLFASQPERINSVIDTAFLNSVKNNIQMICDKKKKVFIRQKYSEDYIQYFEKNETWNKSEERNKYKDGKPIYQWTFNGSNDIVLAALDLVSEKMAALEQNSNKANMENSNANIYEQWRNKVESQLKSCKKYLVSGHAPELVQNDKRNANFINNFIKVNQEQATSFYIDEILQDMKKNEHDIQNYIDGKGINLESNRENNHDANKVTEKDEQNIETQKNINVDENNKDAQGSIEIKNERDVQNYIDGKNTEIESNQRNNAHENKVTEKDEQNIEIQKNINVDENNKDRQNNIETNNELVINKDNHNTDKNRNDDTKIRLNESNSENTNMFKNVNNNIINAQNPNNIQGSKKLERRNLKDNNDNKNETVIFLIIFSYLAFKSYQFNCELEKNALQTLKNNGQKNPKDNQNEDHEQQIPEVDKPNKNNPKRKNYGNKERNGV